MSTLHANILESFGRIPIVRIHRLAPAHVNLYAKLEAFNPMGSVKDRLALGVIEEAERGGRLRPDETVIEATSSRGARQPIRVLLRIRDGAFPQRAAILASDKSLSLIVHRRRAPLSLCAAGLVGASRRSM